MKHFAPVKIRVEKDVVTRVRRSLKGRGQLNVKIGQQVTPDVIIGSFITSAGFRTLNLSVELSVPPQDVEKFLARKMGQRIYKDELLAHKKGGFLGGKKVVIAPADGVLDFLNTKTGELRIAFLPKRIDLPAGVYGIVEAVDVQRGEVVMRTQVSRVHGVFGSGRLREGILHILNKKDVLASKDLIQARYEDHILVGASLFFKEMISVAISLRLSGLITGGLNARDYKGMAGGHLVFPKRTENDIGTSIVVCEGFGAVPIGNDILEILSECEGRFVFIDGNQALINLPSPSSSSLSKVKSTSLPQIQSSDLSVNTKHLEGVSELQPGLKVRIAGNSYLGEQGKLLAVNDSLTLLPSGIKTYLATVETLRRKIQVPVANLEIIL